MILPSRPQQEQRSPRRSSQPDGNSSRRAAEQVANEQEQGSERSARHSYINTNHSKPSKPIQAKQSHQTAAAATSRTTCRGAYQDGGQNLPRTAATTADKISGAASRKKPRKQPPQCTQSRTRTAGNTRPRRAHRAQPEQHRTADEISASKERTAADLPRQSGQPEEAATRSAARHIRPQRTSTAAEPKRTPRDQRQPNNLPRDQDNTRSPTRSAAAHILPQRSAQRRHLPAQRASRGTHQAESTEDDSGTRHDGGGDICQPIRTAAAATKRSPRRSYQERRSTQPPAEIRAAAPEAPAKIRASAEAARPATRSGGSRGEYLSTSQGRRTRSGRAEQPAEPRPCRNGNRTTCRGSTTGAAAGNLPAATAPKRKPNHLPQDQRGKPAAGNPETLYNKNNSI